MIRKRIPLSMAETAEYSEGNEDLVKFMKNFDVLKITDAKELRGKLSELGLMKIKEEHITKIIDTLPEDEEDLNKIFTGISLDENETQSILNEVKKLK
ncbi:hypothetical protein HY448_02660 [Candidatus Pacearchaeota archaeon]|nr:hypothetical protein [Candidatus Pacearchaeota archaeon]